MLHRKLLTCFAFIALLIIALFSWQTFSLNREQVRDNRRDKVQLLVEIINNGLKSLMLEGRGREFQKFLDNLIAEDILAIRIFTEEGVILNSTVPGEIGRRVPDKDFSVYRQHEDLSIYADSVEGKKIFSKIVLIRNDRMCQGCHGNMNSVRGILDVEFSSRETDSKVHTAALGALRSGAITLALLVAVLGMLSVYFVRGPLKEMVASIEDAARGDSPVLLAAGRKDELGRLAEGLNTIMADIALKKEEIARCAADRSMSVEKMASLGELATAVAHDIKNPLAGISGALQVLAEDYPEDSPRKEIAGEILEEIERLDSAVRDLLFFAHQPEMHLIPVDINAIIEKVKNQVAPKAEAQKVRVDQHSDVPVSASVDPEQLERALVSIVLHSLQSMPYGGQLKFTACENTETDEVEMTISDTGQGLREEQLRDIFKPFFSTRHTGSGLGLAISRNIVEGHGGRMDVESEVGMGTRYRITLPGPGHSG